MLTVTTSPPSTNEAGSVTLPEITKLSVPSTSWSSQILIARTWMLLSLVPCSNVTFVSNVSVVLAREKSSPSVRSDIKELTLNQCSSIKHAVGLSCNLPVALPLTTTTVTIIGSWRVTLGGLSRYWTSSFTSVPSLVVVIFCRNSTWIAVCVHVNLF